MLKVEKYVRTNDGYIFEIINTNDFREPSMRYGIEASYLEDVKFIGDEYLEKVGFKSSTNIIDLIEERDILKIEEQKGVYTICEVELFKEPYTNHHFLGVRIDNRPMARRLCELNIKSILTKEQFESMEYKVGENQ